MQREAPRDTGKRIERLRKARGITRAAAALHVGCAYQTFFNWEKGVSKPSMDHVLQLSRLFCVPASEILGQIPHAPSVDVSKEFQAWLKTYKPLDLTAHEQAWLASMAFPGSSHPGPEFYTITLQAYRMGVSRAQGLLTSTRAQPAPAPHKKLRTG